MSENGEETAGASSAAGEPEATADDGQATDEAASHAPGGESAEATTELPETTVSASEVQGWRGHRLDEIGGANVGRVEGVFVDEKTGQPEWILARMGRFGHYTLVPARDAVEGVKRVWVPYTRDQVRRGPKCDPRASLTAAAERELLAHYGIMASAGRAPQIAERLETDVTAVPV